MRGLEPLLPRWGVEVEVVKMDEYEADGYLGDQEQQQRHCFFGQYHLAEVEDL